MTRQNLGGIHPATMTQSFGTGDILLASALMAIGIPLEQGNECDLVERERGSYGRFHLLHHSQCGKYQTEEVMRAWSGQVLLLANHPFQWLMSFIKARPSGVSTVQDWFGWATDHCRDLGISLAGLPTNLAQIEDLTHRAPEARESYIFAFVHCRDLAMRLFLEKRRVKIMQTRGRASTLIDVRLPMPQRKELLSRLEGS